ncbi:MAG TPA: RagB/SusD family nutrient uptake outer membrane protein, partial [Hanamia sp.]
KIKLFPILSFAGLALAILLISCKKFVQVGPPPTQAELSKIFSSDQTANSATIGLYYQMAANNLTFFNGAITVYTGLSGDEIVNVNANSGYDAFKINSIQSDNSTINSKFWNNAYTYIYQANAVLEGLNNSTTLTQSVKQQLEGEMLFTRALNYFYLVNLFNDVPLEKSTDYNVNSVMPRTASKKVYEQIIADLIVAKNLLNSSLPTSTNTRPNKWAATALLARVYLYQKDWANAEEQASEVINSEAYNLEPNLNNVFISTSQETIFQLMRPTSNTSEGSAFIPASTSAKPVFAVTNYLLNEFETGDNRKTSWLRSNTVNGQSYYYPYKYKVRSSTTVSEYYIVIRLAELYLIRAEAKAEQNNITGAQADINIIRNRAGLLNTAASTVSDLLTAVANERQVELFAEWGHRWLDLKRMGTADEILSIRKGPAWHASDTLYPIPFTQIQRNPFLTQNSGY